MDALLTIDAGFGCVVFNANPQNISLQTTYVY